MHETNENHLQIRSQSALARSNFDLGHYSHSLLTETETNQNVLTMSKMLSGVLIKLVSLGNLHLGYIASLDLPGIALSSLSGCAR